jgi:hypothetical protein
VATYVLSFPGGPSSVAAYLRAGWSLGNTQQRYIHEGDGGDQLAGRVACGLPLNNLDFTVLPPHFKRTFAFPEDYWTSEFANYESFPECFRQALPYLMASLVYHYDWLMLNLPALHPVRNCLAFNNGYLQNWGQFVVCGRTVSDSDMIATGIPPTLIISQEVDRLMTTVREMETTLLSRNEDLQQYLENILTQLPSSVEERISARFDIAGVIQLTREDLERSARNQEERILNRVEILMNQRLVQPLVHDNAVTNADINDNPQENFQYFNYGGQFHKVPQDFRFLSMNVKSTFDFWHFGDRSKRICPFKNLRQADLPNKKEDGKRLIKARRIMAEIERRAQIDGLWPSHQSIRSLGLTNANKIFKDGYDKLITSIEDGKRRRNVIFNQYRRENEIQYVTLFNDVKYLNSVNDSD